MTMHEPATPNENDLVLKAVGCCIKYNPAQKKVAIIIFKMKTLITLMKFTG
tara:strand:- start:7405 stop:7557 length:153 start_codon:yes stop_codon:yes gene_type:complete